MRTWYDTEFVERGPGHAIELLSIGMVREDGAELYRVLADVPRVAQHYASTHEWLGPNVWAHLPTKEGPLTFETGSASRIDLDHPDVAPRAQVAEEVWLFCTEGLGMNENAELWAYYGAYDHVCLAQLFGKMIDLPKGMPMVTFDLVQFMRQHGFTRDELPKQAADEHHALADARWTRAAWEYVRDES